jgi:hypothetical protein
MANEVDFSEVLITPAAKMVRDIGASVADAQRQMDQAAVQAQADLHTQFPDLDQAGYQVTWYQIPEVQVELKMAMHYEKKSADAPLRVYLSPYNAKYSSALNFSADGSSTLKLKIVPVPAAVPAPNR